MRMVAGFKTAAFAAAMITISLHAATVDEVIVRQQWPWSTDVKVEYRISGVTAPVNISVAAYDGDTPLDSSKLAASMKGDLFGIAKDCYGSFTIDVTNAFGTASLAIMNFNVRLTLTASAANMADVLYKVVDLDSGAVTDITRADFYGNKYGSFETNFTAIASDFTTSLKDVLIWTEVTNNPIYKTDKLVMRKIPAASWGTWLMGAGANGQSTPTTLHSVGAAGDQCPVQLTSDYYIGVFPMTQAQNKKIYGTCGYYFSNETVFVDHLYKPVTGLQWWRLRGETRYSDYDAVTGTPAADSVCGLLKAKTGGRLSFDLPTEAQWEFAARGGVTNAILISGKGWANAYIDEVAWTADNFNEAGYSETQTIAVGRKCPNAFGLYDVLGNVWEFCRDYTDNGLYTYTDNPVENPTGTVDRDNAKDSSDRPKHIARGGSHISYSRYYCSLRSRLSAHENQQANTYGYRVICTVP